MSDVMLSGKTAVVTGANTGIGKETARDLARRGARVILACRSQERGDAARDDIVNDTGNHEVHVRLLDLASLDSVRKFAAEFNQNETRLDLLVNNAGVFMGKERLETTDGFEMHFGINHLGHFLLTNLLLAKLRDSVPSRVVTLSSELHKFYGVDFENIQLKRSYSSLRGYGQSKSANVMFGVHLAKLLQGSGVTTYSVDPGAVRTEITRNLSTCIDCLFSFAFCCFSCCIDRQTPSEGSGTTIYCCVDPGISQESGLYYSKCKVTPAKAHATDLDRAERLWTISADMVGLAL